MSAALVGNIINTLLLISALGYAAIVLGHGVGWWSLDAFGKNWASDGFCLSFKETHFHSHLLCFYGDALFTVVLMWLLKGECRPELQLVKEGVPSIFFHGFAHALLWYNEQYLGNKSDPTKTWLGSDPKALPVLVVSGIGIFAFWIAFLCSQKSSVPLWFNLVQSLVHTVVVGWLCPLLLVFAYVNTVLFVNFTGILLVDGLKGKKDAFYVATVGLQFVPVMVAAWAEPLLCDAGLVNWGGHILFDFSIPLAQLCYVAVASTMTARSHVKVH
jgi:hypothetical protein